MTLSHLECLKTASDLNHKNTFDGFVTTDDARYDIQDDVFDPIVKIIDHSQQEMTYVSYIIDQIRAIFTRVRRKDLTPKTLRRMCSCKSPLHNNRFGVLKYILFICCLMLLLILSNVYFSWIKAFKHKLHIPLLNPYRINTPKHQRPIQSPLQRHVRIKKPSLGQPFNAEVWSNKTVNTRQNYLILYWSKIRGHMARIQKKAEYERNNHVWPYTYAGGGTCPVSCELTNDRSRAKEANAFVVHSRLTDVWDFPPLEHLAPWILQNNENPVYTPALSDPRIMSKFNLLISYRLDSDFPSPIYPMPTNSTPIPFNQRLGTVLAVFSKCEVVRTEYMRQLMNFIDVHSYGACLKNKDGLIGLYGQINGRYVFKDYKLVLTRFYKFSLVFMNQDCKYFVDDRLYHALDTGSVPVYMGTDEIDQFLPGNLKTAIIRLSDFKSVKKLAEYLKFLNGNETAYNKYLEWKTLGIGEISNTTIGRWWKQKYPLFCQVCMRLSQGNLHPGLDIDTCKPRQYLDWNLYPPYGSDVAIDNNNKTDIRVFLTQIVYRTAILLLVLVILYHAITVLYSIKNISYLKP